MKRSALCIVLLVMSLAAQAQTPFPAPFEKKSARATVDFRVGGMWPGREAVFTGIRTRTSLGVRVAPYLGKGKLSHRLSIPITVDYVPISTREYYDSGLGSDARFREQYVVINPAVGFDIVQTAHVDLTAHFGGALVGNLTTFELPTDFGQWEDVCHLNAFDPYCPSNWDFSGNGGASLRIFPKENFPLYFGVDYTGYAVLRNQLVGTIGFAF
ncbi:MAG: hypothetical protein HY508_07865 [Acidobacteria bacterium]|nr:hypothetical protein [Acidobacteriota bacterium]